MMTSVLPEWILERYLLGELPRVKIQEIDSLCEQDEVLVKRIKKISGSNQEILKRYPGSRLIPGIINRFNREKKKATEVLIYKWAAAASSLAVLALVLGLGIFPLLESKQNASVHPGYIGDSRIKGGEHNGLSGTYLILHRRNSDGVEVLAEGDITKRGDLLQLGYVAAGDSFGVIFSIDGEGVVTLHYPENRSDSTALIGYDKIFLPYAYELDDAPDFERFFFITSSSEINVEAILEKAWILAEDPVLARSANLDLDFVFKQFTIIVRKERE